MAHYYRALPAASSDSLPWGPQINYYRESPANKDVNMSFEYDEDGHPIAVSMSQIDYSKFVLPSNKLSLDAVDDDESFDSDKGKILYSDTASVGIYCYACKQWRFEVTVPTKEDIECEIRQVSEEYCCPNCFSYTTIKYLASIVDYKDSIKYGFYVSLNQELPLDVAIGSKIPVLENDYDDDADEFNPFSDEDEDGSIIQRAKGARLNALGKFYGVPREAVSTSWNEPYESMWD